MKSPKYSHFILVLPLYLIPIAVFGFSLRDSTFKTTIEYVIRLTNILTPVLSGLAFIVFFWGLSKFILNLDKQAELENGKNYMMWGILVLFILLSFSTIIGLISSEFEIGDRNPDRNSILLPTG